MNKLKLYLMAAGTTPFVIVCICLYFFNTPLLPDLVKFISSYGLVVFSFISGTHWGISLQSPHQHIYNLLSVLTALIVWALYIILSFKLYTLSLALSFLFILFIDQHMYSCKLISKHYLFSRYLITLIVLLSLTLIGIQS